MLTLSSTENRFDQKTRFENFINSKKSLQETKMSSGGGEDNRADEIEDLDPSELGTKEHWDKAYQDELNNFKSHGVVGDVWFGEDVMYKIVRYIERTPEITTESRFVDLGCGNGALLLELAREGYTNSTGLDYSENAVNMAAALLQSEDFSVEFKTFDLLKTHEESTLEKYDVCLDKGTFDAISLCPDIPQSEARKLYFENVIKLMKDDGRFIITSCNWTTKEIVTFASQWFSFKAEVPTASFNFGGKTGSLVSIVVLTKSVG